ncbi:hypothetical protein COCCADRAFT_103238, partial [Bipolaris zeicola 26-R-13]
NSIKIKFEYILEISKIRYYTILVDSEILEELNLTYRSAATYYYYYYYCLTSCVSPKAI